MQKTLARQKQELEKASARMEELNTLFRKLYEDNALGKLSDEQFVFLTSGYDEEKETLTHRIAELSQEIDKATKRSTDVRKFVALVRKYTAIQELTYENVHEFIDRIVIHETDKETNTRKIEIFYSFIGKVEWLPYVTPPYEAHDYALLGAAADAVLLMTYGSDC